MKFIGVNDYYDEHLMLININHIVRIARDEEDECANLFLINGEKIRVLSSLEDLQGAIRKILSND